MAEAERDYELTVYRRLPNERFKLLKPRPAVVRTKAGGFVVKDSKPNGDPYPVHGPKANHYKLLFTRVPAMADEFNPVSDTECFCNCDCNCDCSCDCTGDCDCPGTCYCVCDCQPGDVCDCDCFCVCDCDCTSDCDCAAIDLDDPAADDVGG